jgi:nitrate reductase gamma subunit
MKILISLAAVAALFGLGLLGGYGTVPEAILGVLVPYLALALFLGGLIYKVLAWARVPVPFRIPTTCGQQKSLPWIKHAPLENPSGTPGVVGRLFLEVLLFRSLFRNTTARLLQGGRLVYQTSLWLWLGALAFHWSMLLIVLRHYRLFTGQAPSWLLFLEEFDGFLDVGVPVVFLTSVVFLAAVSFLLLRRLLRPQMRYMSLPEDYFLLFLLLGVGLSGFCLRHLTKTDMAAVQEFTVGLVIFRPVHPGGISPLFFGHLVLVSVLLACIPLSKMVHLAGVFLSPTRNLANNNRMVRHVNPWDYPVKVHSYAEYEDELRVKMKGAGIPVEKE